MTQDQGSAEYGEMPANAFATGQGDFAHTVKCLPAQLIEYADHLDKVGDGEIADDLHKDGRKSLGCILALLRSRTNYDFSQDKESTAIRTVQRRIRVTRSASPDDYLQGLCNRMPSSTGCSTKC